MLLLLWIKKIFFNKDTSIFYLVFILLKLSELYTHIECSNILLQLPKIDIFDCRDFLIILYGIEKALKTLLGILISHYCKQSISKILLYSNEAKNTTLNLNNKL